MKLLGDILLSLIQAILSIFLGKGRPITDVQSDNLPTKVTDFDRHLAGALILDYEARRDAEGHIEVYTPRGSTFEVAGITVKDHPQEAKRLRSLLRQGLYGQAENEAASYYMKYSDPCAEWFSIPALEFFARDCYVNRGPTGAAKIAQRALGVAVDGQWGPQSQAAASKIAIAENFINNFRQAREWYELQEYGHRVHVWAGLVNRWNRAATDALKHFPHKPANWRDRDLTEPKSTGSPVIIKSSWPSQSGVAEYYGAVGQNQMDLALPYPMLIAWDKSKVIHKFSIHKRVHDSALACFREIARVYTPEEIEDLGLNLFGGCLNVRKMRGGSNYSMHSWGIAIDFDPDRNQLRWGRDKARLARPDAEKFWNIWEAAGWRSLGRTHNYDWMHVQATS